MPEFGTELRYVKGIGEARARAFGRLGVHDLAGLVSFFPRAYEDRTRLVRIAELADGDLVCVEAVVGTEPQLSRIRRGLDLLRFRAVDETGAMQLTFFNQAYLKDQFRKGESYVFYGRAQVKGRFVSMTNPVFDRLADFGR